MSDKAKCSGCHDDLYNRPGNSDGGTCWSLASAKMRWRWVINMWTPMDRRDRFRRVKVYTCFHGSGNQRDIYMKRLPEHLGGDWADERDRIEHELKNAENLQCPICGEPKDGIYFCKDCEIARRADARPASGGDS